MARTKQEKNVKPIRPKTAVSVETATSAIQEISDWILRDFSESKVEMLTGLFMSGRLTYSAEKRIRFKLVEPVGDKEFLSIGRLKNSALKEYGIDPIAMQESETPGEDMEKIVKASTGITDDEFNDMSFDEVGFIFGLVSVFFL